LGKSVATEQVGVGVQGLEVTRGVITGIADFSDSRAGDLILNAEGVGFGRGWRKLELTKVWLRVPGLTQSECTYPRLALTVTKLARRLEAAGGNKSGRGAGGASQRACVHSTGAELAEFRLML